MAEKVLIVDDDIETINFLSLVLGRQGYQVLSAKNGVEALTQAQNERPDLIVLDVMMPGMDGLEVARTLRNHPKTALIPILMFTAKTLMEDKVAGYEAGVDIYLTKPVHPVELQANIKALLSQRKTHTEAEAGEGYVVGVLAAKGGLGASTLALNLAIAYQQKTKKPVIAAELRPGQGCWAIELGLPGAGGLTRLLRQSVHEISPSSVEDALEPTNFGVRLLLASNSSDDLECITAGGQYEALIRQLPQLAPLVTLDIGTNFLPAFDQVTGLCHELILVTEPQPVAVKRTRQLIDELRGKSFGTSRALSVVLLSRVRADMALSMTQVEEQLGHRIALGIPPAAEQAFSAAQRAIPLMMVQPEGLVAQQFTRLAELVHEREPK